MNFQSLTVALLVALSFVYAAWTLTPQTLRATLLAAVAYFVMPFDAIPDALAVVGFTDDATVLAAAIAVAGAHILPVHREHARALLLKAPRN
jgi:uncharacterized membrane protein YkvA (DUF1232 family)